jgi:hypothetical protein
MTAAVALIAVTAERGRSAARDGVQHLDLWPG